MRVKPFDYKKRNMSVWNEVAPRYHKRWATAKKGPFQSTKKLVELIDVKKGDHILDVASGTGVVTKLLNQKVGKSGFVVGADTATTAIKVAKKWNKKTPNLLFVNADAENFSFKEKFDIITCQYALFFFPNAQKALKNMKNSLKESGKLGISVHGHPDRVPYFDSIFDAVTKFIPNYVPPGTPDFDRFGTKKALRDEIKKAGFRKITVKDYNFPYSPGTFEQYWSNYLRYVAKPIKEKLDSLERSQRKELKEMVRDNTKQYTKKNGMIQFPWEVLILTAKH
ncbi:MAG: methyltransferase domain-containing protein [Nitrosopumilus sp.]|jgi:ubiquinone/menaquinone biosynthesis C-methylase UbiE|nr:methyltransferase domain-containing protein [Nitrosopumilaceae archaeon]RMW34838.1 MAG: methyltransferase domain-containing protein [Nitrosopumilus sp.]